ncbi:MAG: 30S ribosome-binding factor RbfA, partial [Gemmiger qucibialis]
MPSKNHGRMAQDMKRELIAIIGEMKDPRVSGGLLTVTRLDVTPDLDVAKVYISVMGREGGADPVVKALNKASGHIRTEVSRRMHIRKAPRFVFTKDDSAAYAVHIDQLLQDIEKHTPQHRQNRKSRNNLPRLYLKSRKCSLFLQTQPDFALKNTKNPCGSLLYILLVLAKYLSFS